MRRTKSSIQKLLVTEYRAKVCNPIYHMANSLQILYILRKLTQRIEQS